MRVLLVEDNLQLSRSLTQALSEVGMVLDTVADGLHADQLLQVEHYDVVVLDLSLPRMNGLDVLRRMRNRGNQAPVLILTATGETQDRVHGLNLGADDYLRKPFDLSELEARIRALARRSMGRGNTQISIGNLVYDSVGRIFTMRGEPLVLPPREHAVLEVLIARAGKPVSKAVLSEQLCSLDDAVSAEAIEIYVHRLRKRLEGSATGIRTLRGLGYLLEATDAASA